ncbi:MAG: hypothetical protein NC337_14885 [Roseburia sp.]|nr:hypothetical protein [Roseburia sp.]
MENQQIYEILLRTQCEAYQNMLALLERIERLDESLAAITAQSRPDVNRIGRITAQKEQLIQRLDALSLHAVQANRELEGMSALCLQIGAHPLYRRSEELKLEAYRRVTAVIRKEDTRNPEIIRHLEAYQEALTLDLKIKDVPLSKRQLFLFVPKKGES